MMKRGSMQKAFIDMETEKIAQSVIEALDGYDYKGQALEVKFSDPDTAKQYPTSKFKKKGDRQSSKRGDEGGYRGDRKDNREGSRRGGFGRGGRGEDGVKRRNTYDYDKGGDYNRGKRGYDDEYYDYEDDDYYEEDDRRQGGGSNSYRKSRENDGYRSRGSYRGDRGGGNSRGGRDYNRGDNSWRGDRNYDNRNKQKDNRTYEASQAENEERVLYVNNLNYDTTESGLETAFKKYGTVERVAIGYRRDGRSLGNAQVQFKTKEEAEEAIKNMDQTEVDGRPIKVKVFKSYENYKKEKEAQSPMLKGGDEEDN